VSRRPDADEPVRYVLRLEGHLDPHWAAWFGGLTPVPQDDGTTLLEGLVSDQAELHGLLAKVRDLGAILISLSSTDRTGSDRRHDIPDQVDPSDEGVTRCP